MLVLHGKYLESSELPSNERFPSAVIVSLLVGTKTIDLVAPDDLAQQVAQLKPYEDVEFELRWRALDLRSLNASVGGRAYRLSIAGLISSGAVS